MPIDIEKLKKIMESAVSRAKHNDGSEVEFMTADNITKSLALIEQLETGKKPKGKVIEYDLSGL